MPAGDPAVWLGMGQRELELGGPHLGRLSEASDVREDPQALRQRMEQDGYLLLRGLHQPERVEAARAAILEGLDENGQLDPTRPRDEAKVGPQGRGAFLGGSRRFTRHPAFLSLVEDPGLMSFFESFLAGPVCTYDYKWLRVVAPGANTGAHYDIVYMGRGTDRVYTLWTPLGDVPLASGPLAILAGSHQLEKVRETYGRMDVDRDNVAGWFSTDPLELCERYGLRWLTSEFQAGDALVFSMYTMHASLNNATDRYRLSCDTRYQRADEPVDERWVGDDPKAHYAWMKGEPVPMDIARKEWGV